MRRLPLRTSVVALAISGMGRLAAAQTPETPPPPASDAAPPPAPLPPADVPPPPPPVEVAPMAPPPQQPPAAPVVLAPPPAPTSSTPLKEMMAKFSATFYGFVETDGIYDSTQTFNDLAGNGAIQHDTPTGTNYAAHHGRTTFSVRNSRLGFKLKGPETETIKSSAIAEMDFLGNQPQGSPSPTGSPAVTEGSYYGNPTFRIRHMAVKLETPYVDILAGQYWQLFGWQSMFHPNTVEMQGVPGQIYSRAVQFRLSHTFKSDPVNVELAVAAARPPQRDSEIPDGHAGIRLAVNGWKGMHTVGAAGSAIDSLSIGFSTVGRYFKVQNFATPSESISINGYGYSVDALLPIVPATDVNHPDNALTLTGSFVYGQAIADLYTGLTGGATSTVSMASGFSQDFDNNGLIAYDSNGVLHAIRWESYIVGLQYYLPTPNRMFLSANYSHMHSSDIQALGATSGKLFNKSDWVDGNLFVDATASVRFGLEYAYYHQNFLDGTTGKNSRLQFSAFYIW
jgi:hypothetical protein